MYTPAHIVHKILDEVGYDSEGILGKPVVDPSCGDGRILVEVVKRIVAFSLKTDLENNLHQVHGWDIDAEALTKCEEHLNEIIKPTGLYIKWNLVIQDALEILEPTKKFDFIVGNPPYIRIQHLPKQQRLFLQTNYRFCATGSTDTYVAFFELADRLLSESGTCAFITPNSYFFSETARPLREYFEKNKGLKLITNFGSVRVFENTGTYAAITVFGKKPRAHFNYELSNENFKYESRSIDCDELAQQRLWQLSVRVPNNQNGTRLGDVCQISVGVTTLSDRDYLFSIIERAQNGKVKVRSKNGFETVLESGVLKPIVKASRMKSGDEAISEYILFPYKKEEFDKHTIIPESEMIRRYPLAYKYLLSLRSTLDKRDNGKVNKVAWYAFGRAQGLDTSFGEKIIFSPMNKTPKFIYYANPDVTVYSGYFLKYSGNYQKLLPVLNSREMAEYMAIAGRDFRGGWKGYSKKIVENYRLTDAQLNNLKLSQ